MINVRTNLDRVQNEIIVIQRNLLCHKALFSTGPIYQFLGLDKGINVNSTLLFVDSFLSSYEAYFMRGLLKKKKHKLARSVYICYINDVLSFKNSKIGSHYYSILVISDFRDPLIVIIVIIFTK
jgi:hypothetical protein